MARPALTIIEPTNVGTLCISTAKPLTVNRILWMTTLQFGPTKTLETAMRYRCHAKRLQRVVCILSATALTAWATTASAQTNVQRFTDDIVMPLFADTATSVIKGRLWTDERPVPLKRSQSCFALYGNAEHYRSLGYLPPSGWGNAHAVGTSAMLAIDADLIHSLLQRCRVEAETACSKRGDVSAVVEAVQSMAVIRTMFSDLDPQRRDGPPTTQSFRHPVGDDDGTWMEKTLANCARFEFRWTSAHEHRCVHVTPNWMFEVTARLPIRASAMRPDLTAGIPDLKVEFDLAKGPATFKAKAPGKQKEGISLTYTKFHPIRDLEFQIETLILDDLSRAEARGVTFSPPNLFEATAVVIPGLGSKQQNFEHWRRGFLSVYRNAGLGQSGTAQNEAIVLDRFVSSNYPVLLSTQVSGEGTSLDNTQDGCIPIDRSRFELVHTPGEH